jgi:hypothetical protein
MNHKETKDSLTPFSDQELHQQPGYQKLGFLNGLLIGLALALGSWGLEALRLASLPVPLQYTGLIFGSLAVILLCGLAGWLSSRLGKTGMTFLIWLAAAGLISILIGYLPSYGRTLAVWLAEPRFFGLNIYPFAVGSIAGLLLAGLFVIVLLAILAILQEYRLEGIYRELGSNERLTRAAWFLLLLPVPVAIIVGFISNSTRSNEGMGSLQLVHQAIQVNLTYEGDLFQLGLADGISYNALRGVRGKLSPQYSLMIGEVEPESATTFVVAHFGNGAWVNCRLLGGQLSFCYDAAPPYTTGLASFIMGTEAPEDCRGCLPGASDEWQAWLQARRAEFGDAPQIYRLAQWGSYVLMRAESAAGDYAVECWFQGINSVRLERCIEVDGAS